MGDNLCNAIDNEDTMSIKYEGQQSVCPWIDATRSNMWQLVASASNLWITIDDTNGLWLQSFSRGDGK